MNFTEVSIGGIWTAAAINVLGYIWHAYSATYSGFPDPGAAGAGSDIPTIIPPIRKGKPGPPGSPRVAPVPKRIPLVPFPGRPRLHAPPQGVHPGTPPIYVPPNAPRPAPAPAPNPNAPQPGSPWGGIPGLGPAAPDAPGFDIPGIGIRIPLPFPI